MTTDGATRVAYLHRLRRALGTAALRLQNRDFADDLLDEVKSLYTELDQFTGTPFRELNNMLASICCTTPWLLTRNAAVRDAAIDRLLDAGLLAKNAAYRLAYGLEADNSEEVEA